MTIHRNTPMKANRPNYITLRQRVISLKVHTIHKNLRKPIKRYLYDKFVFINFKLICIITQNACNFDHDDIFVDSIFIKNFFN